MLEITRDHVAKLNDKDLRTLVARLCEAELRQNNLPISAVSAGGHQNAKDGGIDVHVNLAINLACLDFILKPITGFQVKCSDMSASEITSEMRPDGVLRSSIQKLAIDQGAYVIISSKSSTAHSALEDRRNAMRKAISDLPDESTLAVDFYDQERIVSWVRNHSGVGIWLRDKIGEPLSGWRAYENWAFGDLPDSDFLLDDKGRIVSRQTGSLNAMNIEQGIAAMRNVLAMPGGIVRLIGSSGMGKTRLAQALFDSRIGHDALDPTIVIYTDQSHEPIPSARDMIHRHTASGLRAIVVVDNCNPVTHRVLAQKTHASTISLITIEYDVADDEPEETEVFQLESASEQVIEEILKRFASHLSQTDRHRIATSEFSGGNARIALALARTIKHHESLGSINDSGLFERLFFQGRERDEMLMWTAEVCSLVYSFDGETLEGDAAELPVLAELAGLSVNELYRHIEKLRSRDLLQLRSRWRAVLPHAIANRLAHKALEKIPTDSTIKAFSLEGRERLFKSFSRRLSYLHDCEQARNIAKDWFTNTDWLANPARLNELGVTLFRNLAPLAPEQTLQVIEAAALGENSETFLSTGSSNRWEWITLLRSIAYEAKQFDRAAFLLSKFAAAEAPNFYHNSAGSIFKALFQIYLSGTHALIEQRLDLIKKLLDSEDTALWRCALEALDAMLESRHFNFSHDFSFGARSRDSGWEPETRNELVTWYCTALGFARELALLTSLYNMQIRTILAKHFHNLWVEIRIYDDLECLARDLAIHDGWPDVWIAICKTIRLDILTMTPEVTDRLRRLEAELRPSSLVQKVHAYVLSCTYNPLDVVGDVEMEMDVETENASAYSNACYKIYEIVEKLGKDVAGMPDLLEKLLPKLLKNGVNQPRQFGYGIALGTNDLSACWYQFHDVLAILPENDRNIYLLVGFIEAASNRDPDIANQLLNEAIIDPVLGPYLPLFQASIPIDEAGIERIISSFTGGFTKACDYKHLGYNRDAETIPISAFRLIMLELINMSDGYQIAMDLFCMRLNGQKIEKLEIGLEMIVLGRELLTRYDFQVKDHDFAYHLNEIASVCLQDADAYDDTLRICTNLSRALSDYSSEVYNCSELVSTLFRYQPKAALSVFLSSRKKVRCNFFSRLLLLNNESPVNAASPEILLAWAKKNPAVRIPRLAEEIRFLESSNNHQGFTWSPLALRLLELAPDRAAILDIFASRFHPRSWIGSRAGALSPYLLLVKKLQNDTDSLMTTWAKKQEIILTKQIEEDHKHERHIDESFE